MPDRPGPEGLLRKDMEEHLGRPLSRHALRYERSLEAHMRASAPPAWMERLSRIERAAKLAERELDRLRNELRAAAGDDFPRRWREVAEGWDFEEVNEDIRTHNEWYPVERDLPLDPRTGEYRWPYRRDELDAAWILSRFPAAR